MLLIKQLYINRYIKHIELYDIWYNNALEDEEKFVKGVRTLSNKGTVVEKE